MKHLSHYDRNEKFYDCCEITSLIEQICLYNSNLEWWVSESAASEEVIQKAKEYYTKRIRECKIELVYLLNKEYNY